MYKTVTILFLFLFGYKASAQKTINMDSMQSVISQTTDTAFFDEWAMTLGDASYINSIDLGKLYVWFLDRTKELKYPVQNAKYKFRKSITKTITGDYKEALDLINEAIPVFKNDNNALWLAACYNSAGGMIAQQGNLDQGIEYLKTAIKLAPEYGVEEKAAKRSLSNHYNSLGNIYANERQIDSALKYINASYDIAKSNGEYGTKERCFGQLNLAKIHNNNGNPRVALKYARAVLTESQINNYQDIKCFGLYRMALAYEDLKQYDSSFHYYDLALKQTQDHGLKHTEVNVLKSKAYLALKLKRFENAAQSFKEYSQKRDGQILRNQAASVGYLVDRTKEAEQKQSELEKAQLKIQEKQKQRNLRLILFSMIGLLFVFGLIFYQWFQRRKLRQKLAAEKVEKELIKSQIRIINSQMNPHFVFNALNSVQDLIMQKDIRNSNIYLGKFADLMRQTLDYSKQDLISLKKELETVRLYLDLEKLRFGDGFSFSINSELTDDELRGLEIPSLLMQPYIENAIKHGLLHKKGNKELVIDLKKTATTLTIDIIDNGVGRVKSGEINKRRKNNHQSFAMKANEKRLALIKESTTKDISLTISDVEPSGTKVSISFQL